MPAPTVSVADAILVADSDLVIEAAARLGTVPGWPFVAAGSSLLDGRALPFVESIFNQTPYAGPSAGERDELAQYLALSSAAHVLDGWRYISQSSVAFLSGSRTQALHLAYYAELRAGLAILAQSGVGILKGIHFALSSAGDVVWFRGPTHRKVWEAIDSWANQAAHGLEVVRCFSFSGLSGEDWASASGAAIQAVAEYWIKNWSIDLHSLVADTELRNEASYRPNLRGNALASMSESDVRFVRDMSFALSPLDQGQFDIVDRAVINDLCRKSYSLLNDPPNKATLLSYWDNIMQWIHTNRGKTEEEAKEIVGSVRNSFREAGGKLLLDAKSRNDGFKGVYSRSFLLLRLASALLRSQWRETRRRRSPQEWQDRLILDYVVHALVCDSSNPSKDYTILFADQEDAIGKVDEWLTTHVPFNAFELWKQQAPSVLDLCKFERSGAVAVAL